MKLDKSRKIISEMFDDIAGKYDFLNHFFTANLDKRWRRKIVRYFSESSKSTDFIIDLASGTGDMAIELLAINPKKIYALDISPKMLDVLKKKNADARIHVEVAEAENLPVENSCIDLITIAFGIRNFNDLEKSLDEICRVLKPGGMLVVLEMFNLEKRNPVFEFYFTKIMPRLGKAISRSSTAYSYLHTSVMNFKTVNEFIELAERHGFMLEFRKNNFQKFVYSVYLRKM